MSNITVSPSTIKLHAALIRLAKGMISAWEQWLQAHQEPTKIEINPDPVKHFQKIK